MTDRRHHIHHHARFQVTAEHPWRETNGRWVVTKDLHRGDKLVREYGVAARVTAVLDQHREAATYNLEVADYHTYFVGRDRVWVHNACGINLSRLEEAIKEAINTGGELRGITRGPQSISNLDLLLGPNQVRYYVNFADEFGETTNYSVNYDPTTGEFGNIKPSSGSH